MKLHLKLVLILLPTILLLITSPLAVAHVVGEEWVVVPYFSGGLRLETDHSAPQWRGGREVVFNSSWNHEISMVALNNGTHIYFHIRWSDSTNSLSEDDGVAIFFEGAGINGSDDVWLWGTRYGFSSSRGVHSAAVWKDGYWNVAIGRMLAAPAKGNANLTLGESKEGFLKVAAWDGSQGHSFAKIDSASLPHLNLYILPYIDYYPKESFVLLPILGLGLFVFTYKELKATGRRKRR